MFEENTLTLTSAELLANDQDYDGDTLTILFLPDSGVLRLEDQNRVRRLAERWHASPGRPHVVIQGNTDSQRGDDYSYVLGRLMADVVGDLLEREGVPAEAISQVSAGRNFADDSRSVASLRNNRVVISVRYSER